MNLKNLKKGQQVVMHTCMEAEHPIYNGKIWTCKTDSYVDKSNNEVVFLATGSCAPAGGGDSSGI